MYIPKPFYTIKKYFGEITGSMYGDVTIENCYSKCNIELNVPENIVIMEKSVGMVEYSTYYPDTEEIFKGFYSPDDIYPSIANPGDGVVQDVTQVESYQSQEFCDKLNEWVEQNIGYSKWIYDTNKNNGFPYLESLKNSIK